MNILESIKYRYNRRFKSGKHTFISAIDLMQPINGRFTAAQATIITRMLDIESIRRGEKPYWAVRLANLREKFSQEAIEGFIRQSEGLVESMDKYGWDYNLSSVMVNREPFYAYNGTHRMAYALLNNPFQMVPICIDYDGWNWSIEDGIKHFGERGLTKDELETIQNRYIQLIADYKYPYQIIVPQESSAVVEDAIKTIGDIESVKECTINNQTYPSWFSKRDKRFFQEVHNIAIIRFYTTKKDISYKNGEFHSKTIESILASLEIKRYTYTPTVTKSIEMDIWLKENCKEIK